MDAVGNDFRKDSIVGEYRAHDSRIAMGELAHRVERMHGVMCSRIGRSMDSEKDASEWPMATDNAGASWQALAMAAAPSSSGAIVSSLTNPPDRWIQFESKVGSGCRTLMG